MPTAQRDLHRGADKIAAQAEERATIAGLVRELVGTVTRGRLLPVASANLVRLQAVNATTGLPRLPVVGLALPDVKNAGAGMNAPRHAMCSRNSSADGAGPSDRRLDREAHR